MKKLFLLTLTSIFLVPVMAQTSDGNAHSRRSDRKIIELQKIITLTPAQENLIRVAHDAYNRKNDSILFKVSDGIQAAALKRQSDRDFERQLLKVLTEEQKQQYLTVRAAPRTGEGRTEHSQRERSNRKMIELQKIITLTPAQENLIRVAYDVYSSRNDSILFQVSDGVQAAALKRQSDRDFEHQLLSILTEEQKQQYLTVRAAPRVGEGRTEQSQRERSNRKIIELKKIIDLTPLQENLIRVAHDTYNSRNDSILFRVSDGVQATLLKRQSDRDFERQLLKILTEEQKQQYLTVKSTPSVGERRTEQSQNQRPNRKIIELKKIIDLTPEQEETFRAAYIRYQETGDSILLKIQDATVVEELSYQSGRELHEVLMNTLSEAQRNEYIRITSTPEVQAKAAAKVDELRETGDYTAEQLAEAQRQIFDYLMLEKIVYVRDKYDLRKQKENIRMLKKLEPTHLKKANAQEKLRTQGKSVQGKVQW